MVDDRACHGIGRIVLVTELVDEGGLDAHREPRRLVAAEHLKLQEVARHGAHPRDHCPGALRIGEEIEQTLEDAVEEEVVGQFIVLAPPGLEGCAFDRNEQRT